LQFPPSLDLHGYRAPLHRLHVPRVTNCRFCGAPCLLMGIEKHSSRCRPKWRYGGISPDAVRGDAWQ